MIAQQKHTNLTDVYIGIDPGFTGAVAVISAVGALVALYDTPVTQVVFQKSGKLRTRAEFVTPAMVEIFQRYGAIRDVALELITARSGQGVTSMFRFGHGFGLWEGILTALDIKYTRILPTAWKQQFDLINKEKDASRIVAMKLFPAAELKLKKHHGRADALCIAEFARRLDLKEL